MLYDVHVFSVETVHLDVILRVFVSGNHNVPSACFPCEVDKFMCFRLVHVAVCSGGGRWSVVECACRVSVVGGNVRQALVDFCTEPSAVWMLIVKRMERSAIGDVTVRAYVDRRFEFGGRAAYCMPSQSAYVACFRTRGVRARTHCVRACTHYTSMVKKSSLRDFATMTSCTLVPESSYEAKT